MGCGRSLFSELGSFCSDSRSQWRSSGYQWDRQEVPGAGSWGLGDGGRPQDIRNQRRGRLIGITSRRGSLNIYQLGEVTVTNLKVSPLVPTLPISVRDTDKVARKQLQPSPNTSCHDKPTGLCWSSVQFWMPGGIKIWTGYQ